MSDVHSASASGNLRSVVQYIQEQDVSVNTLDQDDRTALHHASINDHPSIVSFLIENGANVNVRDEFGCTALYCL